MNPQLYTGTILANGIVMDRVIVTTTNLPSNGSVTLEYYTDTYGTILASVTVSTDRRLIVMQTLNGTDAAWSVTPTVQDWRECAHKSWISLRMGTTFTIA